MIFELHQRAAKGATSGKDLQGAPAFAFPDLDEYVLPALISPSSKDRLIFEHRRAAKKDSGNNTSSGAATFSFPGASTADLEEVNSAEQEPMPTTPRQIFAHHQQLSSSAKAKSRSSKAKAYFAYPGASTAQLGEGALMRRRFASGASSADLDASAMLEVLTLSHVTADDEPGSLGKAQDDSTDEADHITTTQPLVEADLAQRFLHKTRVPSPTKSSKSSACPTPIRKSKRGKPSELLRSLPDDDKLHERRTRSTSVDASMRKSKKSQHKELFAMESFNLRGDRAEIEAADISALPGSRSNSPAWKRLLKHHTHSSQRKRQSYIFSDALARAAYDPHAQAEVERIQKRNERTRSNSREREPAKSPDNYNLSSRSPPPEQDNQNQTTKAAARTNKQEQRPQYRNEERERRYAALQAGTSPHRAEVRKGSWNRPWGTPVRETRSQQLRRESVRKQQEQRKLSSNLFDGTGIAQGPLASTTEAVLPGSPENKTSRRSQVQEIARSSKTQSDKHAVPTSGKLHSDLADPLLTRASAAENVPARGTALSSNTYEQVGMGQKNPGEYEEGLSTSSGAVEDESEADADKRAASTSTFTVSQRRQSIRLDKNDRGTENKRLGTKNKTSVTTLLKGRRKVAPDHALPEKRPSTTVTDIHIYPTETSAGEPQNNRAHDRGQLTSILAGSDDHVVTSSAAAAGGGNKKAKVKKPKVRPPLATLMLRQWRRLLFIAFIAVGFFYLNRVSSLLELSEPAFLNSFFSVATYQYFSIPDLAVVLVLKFFQTIVAMALPVPLGCVAPFLVIGALAGRIIGQLFLQNAQSLLLDSGLSISDHTPEVLSTAFPGQHGQAGMNGDVVLEAARQARWALVGAVAFTAGGLRAFSIIAIVIELIFLPGLSTELILASFVSIFVSVQITDFGILDSIVLMKGLPAMPTHPPGNFSQRTVLNCAVRRFVQVPRFCSYATLWHQLRKAAYIHHKITHDPRTNDSSAEKENPSGPATQVERGQATHQVGIDAPGAAPAPPHQTPAFNFASSFFNKTKRTKTFESGVFNASFMSNNEMQMYEKSDEEREGSSTFDYPADPPPEGFGQEVVPIVSDGALVGVIGAVDMRLQLQELGLPLWRSEFPNEAEYQTLLNFNHEREMERTVIQLSAEEHLRRTTKRAMSSTTQKTFGIGAADNSGKNSKSLSLSPSPPDEDDPSGPPPAGSTTGTTQLKTQSSSSSSNAASTQHDLTASPHVGKKRPKAEGEALDLAVESVMNRPPSFRISERRSNQVTEAFLHSRNFLFSAKHQNTTQSLLASLRDEEITGVLPGGDTMISSSLRGASNLQIIKEIDQETIGGEPDTMEVTEGADDDEDIIRAALSSTHEHQRLALFREAISAPIDLLKSLHHVHTPLLIGHEMLATDAFTLLNFLQMKYVFVLKPHGEDAEADAEGDNEREKKTMPTPKKHVLAKPDKAVESELLGYCTIETLLKKGHIAPT
ncbi:unnamed protein product [Amoebophrya sp. A120]|nr:unnamed protein product [Amoebophrya sp. A120]|eukprot:GSA120T00001630001.1